MRSYRSLLSLLPRGFIWQGFLCANNFIPKFFRTIGRTFDDFYKEIRKFYGFFLQEPYDDDSLFWILEWEKILGVSVPDSDIDNLPSRANRIRETLVQFALFSFDFVHNQVRLSTAEDAVDELVLSEPDLITIGDFTYPSYFSGLGGDKPALFIQSHYEKEFVNNFLDRIVIFIGKRGYNCGSRVGGRIYSAKTAETWTILRTKIASQSRSAFETIIKRRRPAHVKIDFSYEE